MKPPPTHYEILDLPLTLPNEPAIPQQTLRSAYRHALIRHHPDKANPALKKQEGKSDTYSVDQISEAFGVLSDPKRRREYERDLRLQQHVAGDDGRLETKGWRDWKTGVEVMDLDDLVCSESQNGGVIWYKECRCGDEKGFAVEERELERAADVGDDEVMVGCCGCSLWMRVLFGVLEDEQDKEVLGGEKTVRGDRQECKEGGSTWLAGGSTIKHNQ